MVLCLGALPALGCTPPLEACEEGLWDLQRCSQLVDNMGAAWCEDEQAALKACGCSTSEWGTYWECVGASSSCNEEATTDPDDCPRGWEACLEECEAE